MTTERMRLVSGLVVLVAAGAGFAAGYAVGRGGSGRSDGGGPSSAAAPDPKAAEVSPEKKPKETAPAEKARKKKPPAPQVSVRDLLADLSSPDRNKRLAACAALGRRKDPVAVKPLLDVLHKDKDTDVRYQGAMALSAYGGRVADDLVEALSSENPDVRYKAGNALEKIRPPSAVVKALGAVLTAKSVPARQHAVFLMGSIGTREAVPFLVRALADADEGVVAKAEEGLTAAVKKHRGALEKAAKEAKLPDAARARLEAILARPAKPPAPVEKPGEPVKELHGGDEKPATEPAEGEGEAGP